MLQRRFHHPSSEDVPIEDDALLEELGDYHDDEPVGKSLWFVFMTLVCLVALGLLSYIGLQHVVERGYLDQSEFIFREIELLPGPIMNATHPDERVQIYVTRDGQTLSAYVRPLKRNTPQVEQAHLILDEIFEPSQPNLFRSMIPEGTQVRAYYQMDRTGYLDLSSEFLTPMNPSPIAERLTIYTLVNSLVLNLSEIDALQILVDGSPVESPWGWMDCSSPLGADLSMIQ